MKEELEKHSTGNEFAYTRSKYSGDDCSPLCKTQLLASQMLALRVAQVSGKDERDWLTHWLVTKMFKVANRPFQNGFSP